MRTFSNFAYAIGLLMMVPVPGSQPPAGPIAADKMIGMATSQFSDVGYLCHRRPDFCTAAADVALTVAANARSGFDLVNAWASETVEFKMLSPTLSVAIFVSGQTPPKDFRSTLYE